jgi:hypothetical protein
MPKHLKLGEQATGRANYHGHHRESDMDKGIGYWPLGDRNRDRLALPPMTGNVSLYEERDSIDPYTKYHGK